MNRIVVIVSVTVVMVTAIAAVVVVSVTNHDTTAITGWLAATIIPTAASLFAYSEASKARQNTNGLLHSQIQRADDLEAKLKGTSS